MSAEAIVSLVLGLGAFLVSAWGMWLTHTARTSGFQEALHARQIDACREIVMAAAELDDAVGSLRLSMPEDVPSVRAEVMRRYHELEARLRAWQAILPEGVVSATADFSVGALISVDLWPGELEADQEWKGLGDLLDRIRAELGIDPLTARTQALLRDLSTRALRSPER